MTIKGVSEVTKSKSDITELFLQLLELNVSVYFCWIVNNNITVLRRTAKQFGGRTVITNNHGCTSPVVVRACGIRWIIADERTLLSTFCTKQTIDGRYPVTFASLLTSAMSLRPFSWLYLCLHWVVGAVPRTHKEARGGSCADVE